GFDLVRFIFLQSVLGGTDLQAAQRLLALRAELKPETMMEHVFVDLMLISLAQYRQAALSMPADEREKVTQQRSQTQAERGIWKSYNALQRSQRQRTKAAKDTEAKAQPSRAATTPPEPEVPPQPAPEPVPAPPAQPTPSPPEHLIRIAEQFT